MTFGVYPELTKEYLLTRIRQEDIMTKYLGIPVVFDVLITSPLREDSNPTCSFYYNTNGKLRFRDFSGHFWGDCFDVVAYVLKLDANDKRAFKFILHTIAKDFRIHKYEDNREVVNYEKKTKEYFNKKKAKSITVFNVVPRAFNYHDASYWKQYNVNDNLLLHGKVYAAETIAISKDNQPFINIYNYKPSDPAYCYYGGRYPNGTIKWKIYYPFRKKRGELGFHSNSSFLQGKHMITCGRVGIITKAFKDVLSLRSIGFQAVAPSAESVLITKNEYMFMKSKFDVLVSCMDFGITGKLDRAGISMAWKLREKYGIEPLMFTNGMFGTHDFKAKDFSDYMALYGEGHVKNVIKNIYTKYENDFKKLDKYYYHSLKFTK